MGKECRKTVLYNMSLPFFVRHRPASKLRILPLILAVSGLVSCVKPMEFPPEPYMEFRENIFSYKIGLAGDTTLVLEVKFYFQDGDGDIGRKTEGEVFPYVGDSLHNLHFHLLEVMPDSSFKPVYYRDSTGREYPVEYSYHLHYLEPVNSNSAMSGTITWTVDDFSSTALFMQGRRICYSIYLYDRALHKSNTIYTDPIQL